VQSIHGAGQGSPGWVAHGKLHVGRSLAAIRWAANTATGLKREFRSADSTTMTSKVGSQTPFFPQSWRCFRVSVGVLLALYWNVAVAAIHVLRTSDSPPPLSIWVPALFLSIGAFFFAVLSSSTVRGFVFHPDRAHYYRARDLIGFTAFFTLPALLALF